VTVATAGHHRHHLGGAAVALIFVVVAIVNVMSPSVQVADSRLSVPVAIQLLDHGTLNLEGNAQVAAMSSQYDVRTIDGALLPYFPWPAMLFAAPGVAAAKVAGVDPASMRPSDPNQTWKIEVPTASLLVALTSVLMALIAFDVAPGSLRHRRAFAVLVAFVFAFATGVWSTGSRALWQQTPSMLFLASALLAALRIDRRPAWAVMLGASIAAAFTVRPTNAAIAACFVLWVLITRRKETGWLVLGAALVLVPFVLVNLASYHALLPPYYVPSRLVDEEGMPFVDTAAMFLVSPSRGFIIYSPLVIVAAAGVWLKARRRSLDGLDIVAVAAIVLQLIVTASYGGTGGTTYGPRLMTDATPFVVFLAIPVLLALFSAGIRAGFAGPHRLVAIGVTAIVAWGLVVNAHGALLRSTFCWNATPVFIDDDPYRVWDLDDPQFLRAERDLFNGASVHDVVFGSCPDRRI
jgi:hypothetical protein